MYSDTAHHSEDHNKYSLQPLRILCSGKLNQKNGIYLNVFNLQYVQKSKRP